MVYHMQVGGILQLPPSDHTHFVCIQVQAKDIDQLALEHIPPTSNYDQQFSNVTFSPTCIPVDDTPMVRNRSHDCHMTSRVRCTGGNQHDARNGLLAKMEVSKTKTGKV